MSLETTELRAAARDADDQWKAHKGGCPACGSQVRGSRKPALCRIGRTLRDEASALRKRARDSHKADKAPGPHDVPLFDLSELEP